VPGWPPLEVPLGDPAAFEVARIEAGVPAMGRELTEKTIPQEAGSLVEHAVSFTKGCYTGQELVARLEARGAKVARRLRGVVLDPAGEGLDDATLVLADREVGRLTSVAWSPRFAAPVALAYVRRDVVLPEVAKLAPGGAGAEIRELPL
jgi:folate-binding protein YgfZ